MKQITLHNGPLSATGRTKTEATALLSAKVTAALNADYSPLLLTHGRYSILIWREPTGICSALFEAGHCGPLRATCCHEAGATVQTAAASCRLHLAQLGALKPYIDPRPPAILEGFPALLAEYWGWIAWQRAFLAAPPELVQHQDRHTWASNHQHEHRIQP